MLGHSAQPGQSRYRMRRVPLRLGDAGVKDTIKQMYALVEGPEGVGSPAVRVYALNAARNATKGVNEIAAIYQRVKADIQFRGENEETLQSPQVTLQLGAGDCDDHSMVLVAVLRSLGYHAEFRTVAVASHDPSQYSHVYAVVEDKQTGQWIPLDTTVKSAYPGWQPGNITRQKTFSGGRTMRGMRGVRGLRGFRGLGDDTQVAYAGSPYGTQTVAIVNPADTGELTGNAALFYNLASPFVNAGAAALLPQPPSNQFGMGQSSSTMLLIIGAVAIGAIFLLKR